MRHNQQIIGLWLSCAALGAMITPRAFAMTRFGGGFESVAISVDHASPDSVNYPTSPDLIAGVDAAYQQFWGVAGSGSVVILSPADNSSEFGQAHLHRAPLDDGGLIAESIGETVVGEANFSIMASVMVGTIEAAPVESPLFMSQASWIDLVALEFSHPEREPIWLVGLRITAMVDTMIPYSGWIATTVQAFLPLEAFRLPEGAAAILAHLQNQTGDTADPPDFGGVECVSPGWVGSNGVDCCVHWSSYQDEIAACGSESVAFMLTCAGAGLGAAATLGVGCIPALLKSGGVVAPHLVVPLCITVGIVAGVSAWYGCLLAAWARYRACVARARADYRRTLVDNGCWPAAPGFEP